MPKEDLLDAIGNTPSLVLEGIFVKLEYMNPSSSIKDRIAKKILLDAVSSGKLKEGMTVVEATSGNSGISFAMVCAILGYPFTAIMPSDLSHERYEYLKAYGASIIKTKGEMCVKCSVEKEEELSKDPKYFSVDQFNNPLNVEAYKETLGKEILAEHPEKIDAFVSGVGTGGTLIGVGQAIKEAYPNVKIFAVEPTESPVLSGGSHHRHDIEGIGDGFVPGIFERNKDLVDGIIQISSKEAIAESKRLAKEGIIAGISSAANLLAAKKLKETYQNVVTVFPDKGSRYFSLKIYD